MIKNNKTQHANHKGHIWIMLFAHLLPMGLIIILPMLGFSGPWTLVIPLTLFGILHLWMIRIHILNH